MEKLKEWLKLASRQEQEDLVLHAGTSRDYLYQISTGKRQASADTAARIEIAAKNIGKSSKGRLPVLTRKDICPACADCPYKKKCRE